jgi:hypothetical protein
MARPPKHIYKGMTIHHMVRETLIFSYEKNIGKFRYAPIFRRDIKYEPLPQTATKLYDAICSITKEMSWPTMSWTTHIKYLREMVAEHILIPPKGRRKYNEKPYRLSERKLATYLRYLFERGLLSRIEKETPIGRKPYSGLLFMKLYVEVLLTYRQDRPFPFL